jgi:hypothetical protein
VKKPLQVLSKWSETHDAEYWYVIRRGPTGEGYAIEGYWSQETGLSKLPQFSFPVDQEFVAEEFAKQGKEWRAE